MDWEWEWGWYLVWPAARLNTNCEVLPPEMRSVDVADAAERLIIHIDGSIRDRYNMTTLSLFLFFDLSTILG